MLLLQPLIGLLLISLAHGTVWILNLTAPIHCRGSIDSCPISLSPTDVVVEYGRSFSVNCSSIKTRPQFSLSWDELNDSVVNINGEDIYKNVNVTDWEINVKCYMYSKETNCSQDLPVTIYKTPDSVSITLNHRGPMKEGEQYELQCEVLNVAPVQDLTVTWYKGQTPLNQTTFTDTIQTPVNKVVTLLIRPDRADDGAQYRCEAELDLGAEGPPPTESTLNAEVHYKPQHSSSTESIIKGEEVMLDCTVKANPDPTYTWHSDHLEEEISSSVLQSSTLNPGNYTCTATNTEGSDSKVFIVENQCPVQIIPWRVVVRYGDSVSADCKTSVQHQGMGWEASQGGVSMTRAKSLITWRVSEVTEWDLEPFCYINYKIGNEDQCVVQLPVTVYKTPDSVPITVNHTGPMIEGQQYELQCGVLKVAPVQDLTVTWYKGQTPLNQTTFTDTIQTPVNKAVTLLIRPDRADDGAQYRCEAELDLGAEGPQPPPKVTSDPLNITVHFVPQIKICSSWSPLTGNSLDSYPLSFKSVVGNPRPDIFWRKQSLPVNSSMPLTKYDSGQYEIVVENYLNSNSCFVDITVEYPPELNCTESYEVKEKTLFKNPCIVTGFPEPEFILYKNGKRMQRDFYPKWNDSGLYEISFHNQQGNINTSLTLNILHAPVIFDSREKFVVPADSKITLECNSTGNPEPKVWWSFNNKNISTGRRLVLNIERATPERAGVYTCSARNEFGRIDKTFVVEIKDEFNVYIIILVVVLVLFFLIILFMVLMWKRSKSRGRYDIQSAKPHEMQMINNGGHK